MLDPNGKLAFVTGGSEGIGLEIAKQLVEKSCDVVIFSRSLLKLETAKKNLESSRTTMNQKIETFEMDVTNESQTQETLTSAIKEFGTPHYVINCAGFARPGYIEDLSMDHFRKMMDLNFFGIVHVCKTIMPFLIKNKGGHIINTSSMAGFIGVFGYTGYCGSKFAVIGFSEALRREVAPYGINVSVLCPPNTNTPGLIEENKYKPAEVLKVEEKAKPVNADVVARSTIKALGQNVFYIHPTFDGKLAHTLNRFLPKLLGQFVKRNPV